ncbi:hypothetical protein AAMO2058_000029700 [Amorphochlora amoebiformis]
MRIFLECRYDERSGSRLCLRKRRCRWGNLAILIFGGILALQTRRRKATSYDILLRGYYYGDILVNSDDVDDGWAPVQKPDQFDWNTIDNTLRKDGDYSGSETGETASLKLSEVQSSISTPSDSSSRLGDPLDLEMNSSSTVEIDYRKLEPEFAGSTVWDYMVEELRLKQVKALELEYKKQSKVMEDALADPNNKLLGAEILDKDLPPEAWDNFTKKEKKYYNLLYYDRHLRETSKLKKEKWQAMLNTMRMSREVVHESPIYHTMVEKRKLVKERQARMRALGLKKLSKSEAIRKIQSEIKQAEALGRRINSNSALDFQIGDDVIFRAPSNITYGDPTEMHWRYAWEMPTVRPGPQGPYQWLLASVVTVHPQHNTLDLSIGPRIPCEMVWHYPRIVRSKREQALYLREHAIRKNDTELIAKTTRILEALKGKPDPQKEFQDIIKMARQPVSKAVRQLAWRKLEPYIEKCRKLAKAVEDSGKTILARKRTETAPETVQEGGGEGIHVRGKAGSMRRRGVEGETGSASQEDTEEDSVSEEQRHGNVKSLLRNLDESGRKNMEEALQDRQFSLSREDIRGIGLEMIQGVDFTPGEKNSTSDTQEEEYQFTKHFQHVLKNDFKRREKGVPGKELADGRRRIIDEFLEHQAQRRQEKERQKPSVRSKSEDKWWKQSPKPSPQDHDAEIERTLRELGEQVEQHRSNLTHNSSLSRPEKGRKTGRMSASKARRELEKLLEVQKEKQFPMDTSQLKGMMGLSQLMGLSSIVNGGANEEEEREIETEYSNSTTSTSTTDDSDTDVKAESSDEELLEILRDFNRSKLEAEACQMQGISRRDSKRGSVVSKSESGDRRGSIRDWSEIDTSRWIKSLGRGQRWEEYGLLAEREGIDGTTLVDSTVEDLMEVGFSRIHASLILRRIKTVSISARKPFLLSDSKSRGGGDSEEKSGEKDGEAKCEEYSKQEDDDKVKMDTPETGDSDESADDDSEGNDDGDSDGDGDGGGGGSKDPEYKMQIPGQDDLVASTKDFQPLDTTLVDPIALKETVAESGAMSAVMNKPTFQGGMMQALAETSRKNRNKQIKEITQQSETTINGGSKERSRLGLSNTIAGGRSYAQKKYSDADYRIMKKWKMRPEELSAEDRRLLGKKQSAKRLQRSLKLRAISRTASNYKIPNRDRHLAKKELAERSPHLRVKKPMKHSFAIRAGIEAKQQKREDLKAELEWVSGKTTLDT